VSRHDGHWVLQSEQSHVHFRHKTGWGLVTVRGAFGRFAGQGELGADGSVRGSMVIGADSVETGNKRRDEHLRSADFFDAAAHPDLTYVVHGGEIDDESRLSVAGDLQVAGITRPLAVTAHIRDVSASSALLSVELEIDRSTFGLHWNKMGMIRGLTTVDVVAAFARQ
jgi:polyisoprenoid-binding protein YceI